MQYATAKFCSEKMKNYGSMRKNNLLGLTPEAKSFKTFLSIFADKLAC